MRSTIIATGIAVALSGIVATGVATVKVLPSAASIPAEIAENGAHRFQPTARDVDAPSAISGESRDTLPAFRSASIDSQRLVLKSAALAGDLPRAARFMLAPTAPSASEISRRFASAHVTTDDVQIFHPSLFADVAEPAAPVVDPRRFAGALAVEASLMAGIPLLFGSSDGQASAVPPVERVPEQQIAAVPQPRPAASPATAPATGSAQPQRTTELAYAAPDDGAEDRESLFGGFQKLFNGMSRLPGPGSGIAVYDIRNAVVYMPNGQRLEAHSGLGHMKDNPRYAHVRMKGPTPPNVYNLRMREALFHGVEAVRMLPTDDDLMKGRDGILAHTPMLRGTDGSNGCVSFKHYDKFLAAFKRGEVKRMVVVPDLSELPTYMASL